jgi:hypothetical protein
VANQGFMDTKKAFAARDLHAMLNVVRIQIEFLEASAKHEPEDRELEKRVKKAKNREKVILEKLSESAMS